MENVMKNTFNKIVFLQAESPSWAFRLQKCLTQIFEIVKCIWNCPPPTTNRADKN